MKKTRLWLSLSGLLAGLLLVLVACGPASTEGISPINTPAAGSTSETGPAVPTEAQEIVSLVRKDLAERLNIAQSDISLIDVRAVDWPDTSLGCPQPGQMYDQVITPGYQIVLKIDGREYTYHTGGNNFILCENAEPIVNRDVPAPDELDPQESTLVEQAEADLISRLKIAPDSISLQSIEPVEWPDSSLGCPQPGMNYLMVVTPGYLIKLEAGGRVYEYHTGTQDVVYCENPKPPLSAEPGREVDIEARLADQAKADLAQKLDIPVTQIEVIQVEAVDWPDASLGCPQPGQMYAQVITPGYQIILSVQGKEYDYRTNLSDVFLCKQ